MRPIDKGSHPTNEDGETIVFTHYEDMKNELIRRIGPMCSYCEVKMSQGLAIDHIMPKSRYSHKTLSWDNLLLACPSCNACKGDEDINEKNLHEYLWPDRDNTFLATQYLDDGVVKANPEASEDDQKKITKLLRLVGLEPAPDSAQNVYGKWAERRMVWNKAQIVRAELREHDTPELRDIIVRMIEGHFSIWMTVFRDDEDMRLRILKHFEPWGTAMNCFDSKGTAVQRQSNS